MKKQIRLGLFFCFFYFTFFSQVEERSLNGEWQFKQQQQSRWYTAKVPGNVVKDLQANELIPDPFFADNNNQLQWIENENWEYQTVFNCDKAFLNYSHVDLVFEGLDTYATVYLNDSLILSSDNMFRSYTIDVKKHLKPVENHLKVVFQSAVSLGKLEAQKLTYVLPEGERVFSRKAQFQYGWDFAPRFAACGIWKGVKLKAWMTCKINHWHYRIQSLSDTLANIQLIVESESNITKSLTYQLTYPIQNEYGTSVKKELKRQLIHKGLNSDTLFFSIKNPKRWWCNGLGEPFIYHIKLGLYDEKYKLDEKNTSLGLRQIELITKKDEIGSSFYFKINGKDVFVKGANYIPSDVFLQRKTAQQYLEEISVYKQQQLNMLRIWGGGVYGDDELYEACDKNGLLVWQDFMFACAMYPSNEAWIKTVTGEINEQIMRLRTHPSLALWCGNNEISEAWYNWGWQKQFHYSKKDSTKIYNDYVQLFHQLIPKLLKKNDPSTAYWPTSPSIGWGRQESFNNGDSHYWGVWWGMQAFEEYQKKVGRFVSEYGFQSLPAIESIQQVMNPHELTGEKKAHEILSLKSIKAHQKHKTGFETIQQYLKQNYDTLLSLSNYIYVSQLQQRDAMKIAIEAHRANKPRCMGTLFWQLNDCWPGITWSAIDYFHQPKALFYELKKLYHQHLIQITNNQNNIQVTCISDTLTKFDAQVQVQLCNFNSEIIWQQQFPTQVKPESPSIIRIAKLQLPLFDSSKVYLKTTLKIAERTLCNNYYFFKSVKQLNLPKATLNIRKVDQQEYELSSDVFIKDLYLFDKNQSILLTDNYFNLEAGIKKRIKVLTANKDIQQVQFSSLSLNQ